MKKIASISVLLLLPSLVWMVTSNSFMQKEIGIALSAQSTSMAEGSKSYYSTMVDPRDGQTYKIAKVGNQWWMVENLNYSTTGGFIPGEERQTNNGKVEKYCPDDKKANCDTYGALYQWAEAIQYFDSTTNVKLRNLSPTVRIHGVCPTGWHIPTTKEWRAMLKIEGKIREGGGVKLNMDPASWKDSNEGYKHNFESLLGGTRDIVGGFSIMVGKYGYWWTTSETNASVSWSYWLNPYEATVYYERTFKAEGLSVRCVKD
jgi:uncharacterized protein (TIGR02145 family)